MKLLILFGPPAVGKLTVGTSLEQESNFRLFHNHQIMDGVMHIFGRNSPVEDKLSRTIRETIIATAAEEGIDLIFTYVWNFSKDKGRQNIEAYKQAYESRGGVVYFVELLAPPDIRASRAGDPRRFTTKPHAPTSNEILEEPVPAKFTSPDPFYFPERYLRIDTSTLAPDAVVAQIKQWLDTTR